jgi:hypothetical protein
MLRSVGGAGLKKVRQNASSAAGNQSKSCASIDCGIAPQQRSDAPAGRAAPVTGLALESAR